MVDYREGVRAIEAGDLEGLRRLLDRGLSPSASSGDVSLIWHAVRRDSVAMTRLLVELGADVHTRYRESRFPVLLVADSPKVIAELARGGADLNATDKVGTTALHRACSAGREDVVRFLLANGAKVNLQDRHGCTPLDNAVAAAFLLLEDGRATRGGFGRQASLGDFDRVFAAVVEGGATYGRDGAGHKIQMDAIQAHLRRARGEPGSDYVASLERAAKQGDIQATARLGTIYRYGLEGVPEDLGRAHELLAKAANAGNADAQASLAMLYYYGQGVPQDYQRSARLARLAAEQGNDLGEEQLGVQYARGHGGPKDLNKARKWLQRASAKGSATAEHLLGEVLVALERFTEARACLERAAAAGYGPSAAELARMLLHGEGGARDPAGAYVWAVAAHAYLASHTGDARDLVDRLLERLEGELRAAQRTALEAEGKRRVNRANAQRATTSPAPPAP